MRILKPGITADQFFAGLHAAPARVLMLDYDGTLAPFRLQRDQAVPYPGVRERLQRLLAAAHTRVVLISGRMAREVAALAALDPAPEVWGTHGWERLGADGSYTLAPLPEAAENGLMEASVLLGERWPGRLETKPASLAFHLRGLSPEQAQAALGQVQPMWEDVARDAGLEVHTFDGGIELRVPGRSKGSAVRQLLSESGPGAVCAYLGDDRTDEDAFAALAGSGLAVLVREAPRDTAADWWIRPPEELLDFLDQWTAACQNDP